MSPPHRLRSSRSRARRRTRPPRRAPSGPRRRARRANTARAALRLRLGAGVPQGPRLLCLSLYKVLGFLVCRPSPQPNWTDDHLDPATRPILVPAFITALNVRRYPLHRPPCCLAGSVGSTSQCRKPRGSPPGGTSSKAIERPCCWKKLATSASTSASACLPPANRLGAHFRQEVGVWPNWDDARGSATGSQREAASEWKQPMYFGPRRTPDGCQSLLAGQCRAMARPVPTG